MSSESVNGSTALPSSVTTTSSVVAIFSLIILCFSSVAYVRFLCSLPWFWSGACRVWVVHVRFLLHFSTLSFLGDPYVPSLGSEVVDL
jgi:hypothetical protein